MEIHLAYNNQKHGPYTRDQVEGFYREGSLPVDTLAWSEGQEKWIPITELVSAASTGATPPALPTRPKSSFASHVLTDGRLGRVNWLLRGVLHMACYLVFLNRLDGTPQVGTFAAILAVPFVWLTLANAAKRLHDLDASAWWSWVVFVPFGGLYLLFAKGTDGPNRFGPKPTNEFSQ